MVKKILLVLSMIFIIIQFFRPAKNLSDAVSQNDITLHFSLSENVQTILKKSCYDCHSNNTVYPWYNNVQPVALWLSNHVNDGKRELNFSEFASYAAKKQYRKLKTIIETIKKSEMPLNTYLWIHKDAILTNDQQTILSNWADSLSKEIKMKNNLPDEPEEKKDQ
jgi:hypothetical protein